MTPAALPEAPVMADPEQLALLKQGVDVWNAWRQEKNWEIIPDLRQADLQEADFRGADLFGTSLEEANLQGAILIDANFSRAILIDADSAFVDRIEKKLNEKGIRFWRDIHHATAGRLEKQVDRAIRHNPTVLLVLSEQSVESDWVEYEAQKARNLETELKRDVLCPVALDDSWKACDWEGRLRQQIEKYHILDFSQWQDATTFDTQFDKLLNGLRIFYEPEDEG